MRLDTPGAPHLTYCTNIHPGEGWDDVRQILATHVPTVRARVAPDRPFGVGLRLSARAAEELEAPGARAELRALLAEHGLYVFTINGFPYGRFHGSRVKEDAYRPDWGEPERVAYADRLARLLAELLADAPEELGGSVSTVPGAFAPRAATPADVERVAGGLRRHAAALHALATRTGRRVVVALEPEPGCLLETTADAVAFFERHLVSGAARAEVAALAGVGTTEAEAIVRRHVGLCLDACHLAVEHEEPAEAVARPARAGIAIAKLQLSAGLEVAFDDPRGLAPLERFADDVYLHQVVERRGDAFARWLDLPEALVAARATAGPRTWRVHFHVPVFREALGPFRSTQPWLRRLLRIVARQPVAPHLEVETYTWDVLPDEYRGAPIADAVARELQWVLDELDADDCAARE